MIRWWTRRDSPLTRWVQRGHRLAQPTQFQELPATWVSGASAPTHCFEWVRNIGVITSWENERRGNSIGAPPQIGAGGTGLCTLARSKTRERGWERSHGVAFSPVFKHDVHTSGNQSQCWSSFEDTIFSINSQSQLWPLCIERILICLCTAERRALTKTERLRSRASSLLSIAPPPP